MTLVTDANRRWWTLAAVTFSLFMVMLDTTIVNVALPAISADLDAEIAQLEWVATAFLLTYAALLLPGGKLADFFGRRRFLIVGLAVFTIASLACGLASSVETLIAARALQGVGAALMMPATHSIISANFEEREHGLAYGTWAGVSMLGLALGPLAGGVLVQQADWPWIFYVNVPLGLAAIAFGWLVIRETKDTSTDQGLDPLGLVLSSAALFALVFALIEGHKYGWTSPVILGLFAATAICLALFVAVEHWQRRPMLDLSLFKISTFTGSNIVSMLVMLVMLGILFFVSIYLQTVLGFTPVQTGATFLPMTLVFLLISPVAGILGDKLGFRWPVAFGMALLGVALVYFSRVATVDAKFTDFLVPLIVGGIGMGIATAPVTAAAMSSIPVEKSGVAAGVLVSFRQTGGALGVSIMGVVVAIQTGDLEPSARRYIPAFVDGFQDSLLLAAGISFLGAVVAVFTIKVVPHVVPAPAPEPAFGRRLAGYTFGGVPSPSLIIPIAQLPQAPVRTPAPAHVPATPAEPLRAPARSPSRRTPVLVLREGPAAAVGARFPVDGELSLGREGADVTLDDPEVSRRHAVVREADGGLVVWDEGSVNGTFVNGRRIYEPTRLADGDMVTIGGTSLLAEVPAPAAATVAAPVPGRAAMAPSLVVREGPPGSVGARFPVEAELSLGREGADVTLDDPEISRRHAVVRPVDDGLLVRDEGSVNGTFVNGRRIYESTRLADGDVLSLGRSSLLVEVPAPAPAAAVTVAAEAAERAVVLPVLVGIEGSVAGQRFPVEVEVLLGREGADITIEDPEVSRRHAWVRAVDGGLVVLDADSANGTFVNGERVGEPRTLGDGDVVTVGRSSLRVELPAPAKGAAVTVAAELPGAAVEPPVLVGVEGPVAGERFPVEGELLLGREAADITVEDPEVSRRHAIVRPVDGGLEVTDEGSANGTFVNGNRIHEPTRLADGDRLKVGRSILAAEVPAPPPELQPTRLSQDAATVLEPNQPPPTRIDPGAQADGESGPPGA
ncbi:MAG TPA: DHA2 family efflux MFS transporter permease subunit [Gaiellaceae bacterium]|jgi:EmrB/QacA subfamily drug resistance transporter